MYNLRAASGRPLTSLIVSAIGILCFFAAAILLPNSSIAQSEKVKAAMADLQAKTAKLGAPKMQGKDLYFGTTKADNSIVESIVKDNGGAATIFAKSGNEFVRVATTVKKDDGSSAVGTALDAKSPAIAKLSGG